MDTFFHRLSPSFIVSVPLFNQTYIAKISFWLVETQGSKIGSIYGLLLLLRTSHHSIGTTVFESFISSSVYVRTAKINYSKKDIFHSAPLNQIFTCLHPIITAPNSHIIGKYRPLPKILFALTKITNNWSWEERTMTTNPFILYLKMSSFTYIVQNRVLKKLLTKKLSAHKNMKKHS